MKIIFFLLFTLTNAYNLCVVGGTSGLGKELVYQSLCANKKVLALTNSSLSINYPYRGEGLNNKITNDIITNNKLTVDKYENFKKYKFDNIVFTTSAGPFQKDYSDKLTNSILKNIKSKLEGMVLVSAHGVGDSLENANLGIKIMDSVYLKDVYRAKNNQENIIKNYGKKNNINTFILRPKALSYGPNMYSVKSRQQLAKEILEYLYLV